ncbi:hypothetical protein [Streptomyces bathyalis]|nr:hypothetical protein [Streptomyces bathyalis]
MDGGEDADGDGDWDWTARVMWGREVLRRLLLDLELLSVLIIFG